MAAPDKAPRIADSRMHRTYCRPRICPTSRSRASNSVFIAPERNMISPMRMKSGTAASVPLVAVVNMLFAYMPKPAVPVSASTPTRLRSRKQTKAGIPATNRTSSSGMPTVNGYHQVIAVRLRLRCIRGVKRLAQEIQRATEQSVGDEDRYPPLGDLIGGDCEHPVAELHPGLVRADPENGEARCCGHRGEQRVPQMAPVPGPRGPPGS